MCENCKYVIKDGKRIICMNNNSLYLYEYVSKCNVCDNYEPKEIKKGDKL